MPVSKESIKTAINNKYKNLGFSDKAIDPVVTYLEGTVTEDSQLEGAVNSVEGMLKGFQSEVDTRVTTAVAKAKTPPADPAKPEGGDKPEPVTPPDDTPAWAKTLIDSNKALSDRLNAIETGKSTETRKSQLESALGGVSDAYKTTVIKAFDRMKFDKDDDFTAYLEEVKTDSAAFVQNEANSSMASSKPPIKPSGPVVKAATKEEADKVLNTMGIKTA